MVDCGRDKSLADLDEDVVAALVPIGVVDVLEMVEVDEQHCETVSRVIGSAHHRVQVRDQRSAIG